MAPIDIALISGYFIISLIIALLLSKRAGTSTEEFFLSGRKLPWWIAGTTMVATTFAADTPLSVTELVATHGIAGNWLWWNMVAGNVLTVFFFAKLWRRSNVLTDVEFIEIRYSGRTAAFLRGFRAVYLGVFLNVIIMGWVNVALSEILTNIFGVSEALVFPYIMGAMAVVGIYSALSGLWGIALTDMFQFLIAMVGCIILAVVVLDLPEVGGIAGLQNKLPEHIFYFFPNLGGSPGDIAAGIMTMTFSSFFAYVLIQWWSSWYPGSEPGGGGYIAQRMMSAKDEKHSVLATLWFTVAHYAVRPWPWIIVALAALVLYPDLPADSKKSGFIFAMRDHLPPGLLGLLVAAFLAAYMSTISTHLNWGTSYLVNDVYRRFIKRESSESGYVMVSRIVTILLIILSSAMVFVIHTISGAWKFLIECGAGLGLVLILRWYWWRINAWSEIVAMVAPVGGVLISRLVLGLEFPVSMYFIVGFTTVMWVTVTFLTRPVDYAVLEAFYRRVRPQGPGWDKFRSIEEEDSGKSGLSGLFLNWILGIILVYSSLIGTGKLIFGEYLTAGIVLSMAVLSFLILRKRIINM